MWPLLDRVRVPQGRERKWRSVLKGNMSVWCQPPPISTYLCSFLRSFITQVSPPVTPDFRTSHEATVWHAHVPETLIEADNCALRPRFYSINEYILFSSCVTAGLNNKEPVNVEPLVVLCCWFSIAVVRSVNAADDTFYIQWAGRCCLWRSDSVFHCWPSACDDQPGRMPSVAANHCSVGMLSYVVKTL